MTTATFETTVAVGVAEAMEHAFEKIEAFSERDVHTAISICDFIQNLFRTARASIETSLSQGVEARDFVAQFEQAVAKLDDIRATVRRVLAKVKGRPLPGMGEILILRYENLDTDLASLRQFLLEAIAHAMRPSNPIDWQRVQKAEEAYARGEMKPFRKIAGVRNGNY